jgi:hypothetical protein
MAGENPPEMRRGIDAVHFRHIDVHHHHTRTEILDQLDCFRGFRYDLKIVIDVQHRTKTLPYHRLSNTEQGQSFNYN